MPAMSQPDLPSPQDPAARVRELEAQVAELQRERLALRLQLAEIKTLAEILSATPDYVGVGDLDGDVLYLNPAARRMSGLGPTSPLVGLRMSDFHPPEAVAMFENDVIPRVLREGEWVGESVLQPPGGHARPVYMLIVCHRDSDGNPKYLSAIMHDISAEKQRELEVRHERDFHSALIAKMPLLLVRTWNRSVRSVNPEVERITGYTAEELKGTGFYTKLYAGEEGAERLAKIAEVFEKTQGELTDYEVTIDTKSGERRQIAWNTVMLRDASGENIETVAIGRDITERHRAIERQRHLQDELIRTQRETLRAVGTPLIPINDQIMVMPLIGALDSERMGQALETLLSGVSERRARVVIIDITGLTEIDAAIARGLTRAAQAVRLIGARVVITGISAGAARTLITAGLDLGDLSTRSTLQDGIAYALDSLKAASGIEKR